MSVEIAVVGGRGKTGRAVISALNSYGAHAEPLGREELTAPVGALNGFQTMYLMAPNMHPDEAEFVGNLLEAAHEAGVQKVVYHSVTAPYVPDMPHHRAKAEGEHLVRTSGLEWTILQPCAYVQNFMPQLVADNPGIVVPYNADRPFGLVDLLDVGEVAARALVEPALVGSTLELGGPELVTIRDLADAASRVLGREVPLTVIPSQEWSVGAGASLKPREHDWLLAMFDYYESYGLPTGGTAVAHVLGRPARSLDEVLERELQDR